MQLSVGEFAAIHQVEYGVANGLLHFLEQKGLAKIASKRPASNGGKGKPTNIWEIPVEINKLDLSKAA